MPECFRYFHEVYCFDNRIDEESKEVQDGDLKRDPNS